ncbi:MAG: DNA-3-methyladenine glycosylase family protein, partial [Chloroflexota bacterium]
QFTTRKAEYLIAVARAVIDGSVSLPALQAGTDDEVVARLTAIRGVGIWTAEWILSRLLGRPRVVAGDLGVRKAVGKTYLGGRLPDEEEVRAVTAHWGDGAEKAQALVLASLAP